MIIDDESQRRLFEEIYLNYRKQMLLVARSVLGSDTDAEDVVHDVFLKIAKKHMSRISKIKNSIDLRNYLLKATKHTALDHLRKRRHEKAILDAVNENNLKKDAEVSDDDRRGYRFFGRNLPGGIVLPLRVGDVCSGGSKTT